MARPRHELALWHTSYTSNGTAISSNHRPAADGAGNVVWSAVTAGVSYASNSNDVAASGAAGASTLVSRADHAHRGVLSVSHTSNTFYGPLTLIPEGTVGITSPSSGTFAINAGADGGGTGSDLGWFIVTDYGATGNGVTDDTAAINSAIAALNTATRGVLYFPAGTYLCSAALTAITATGLALGDGMTGSVDGATLTASKIVCSSGTANFVTFGAGFSVAQLSLVNSAGSVTAGYGIGGTTMNLCRLTDVSVVGFWVNFKLDGGLWAATRCYSRQSHKYGFQITFAAVPDGGDWTMTDCQAVDGANSSDAAVRYESGGGGKIVGLKVNSDPTNGFNHGIDLAVPAGVDTGVLLIENCSIENVRGDAIHGTTTATSSFGLIKISGLQVGLYSNNTGKAISLVGNGTADFFDIVIDSYVFRTNGTARSAITLTNCDLVSLGHGVLDTFNSLVTVTTCTLVTDHNAFIGATAVPSGNTTMTTANTEYPVAFGATDAIDTDAYHDPASNNTRMTIPTHRAGKYRISGGAYVPVTGTTYVDLKIRKGGAAGTILGQFRTASGDGNPIVVVTTPVVVLAAADYVELYAMAGQGSTSAQAANLSVEYLGT